MYLNNNKIFNHRNMIDRIEDKGAADAAGAVTKLSVVGSDDDVIDATGADWEDHVQYKAIPGPEVPEYRALANALRGYVEATGVDVDSAQVVTNEAFHGVLSSLSGYGAKRVTSPVDEAYPVRPEGAERLVSLKVGGLIGKALAVRKVNGAVDALAASSGIIGSVGDARKVAWERIASTLNR